MSLGLLESISIPRLGVLVSTLLFFVFSYRLRMQRAAGIGWASGYRPRSCYLFAAAVLVLMALAMLRPYSGFEDIKIKSEGRDIMAALDVSESMLAKDAGPNRLEFGKRKLLDLISILEQSGSGDRIGIILFAGQGYVYCPLTTDYRIARTFTQSIEPGLVGTAGTDLGSMLEAAGNAVRSTQARSPLLIVLSDGEDLSFASAVVPPNLKVSAIGVGSSEGTPIETSAGTYLKDSQGNMVITRLREDLLRSLTSGGGGTYRRASFDDIDLRTILSAGFGSAAAPSGGTIRSYREVGPYLLWAVVFLLLVLYATGKQHMILPGFAGALLLVHPLHPALATPLSEQALYQGHQAYQRGEYGKAKAIFEARVKEDPADLKALEALGSTEYRLGNYDEAEKHYRALVEQGTEGRTLFDGYYNLGNARLFSKNYRGAVDAYEKALRIKEHDARAEGNLEIARRMLEAEQHSSPEPQSAPSQSASNSSRSGSGSQSAGAWSQTGSSEGSHASGAGSGGSQGRAASGAAESSGHSTQSRPNDGETPQEELPSQSSPPGQGGQSSSASGQQHSSEARSESRDADLSRSSFGSASNGSMAGASQDSISAQPEIGYSPKQHYDPEQLRQEEARAWLNAIPDAPVLLMKKGRGKKDPSGQTW